MTNILSIVILILGFHISGIGQVHEEFTSRDLNNTRWIEMNSSSIMEIGDTTKFDKSSCFNWTIKLKSNGRIIRSVSYCDYSFKHCKRERFKSGFWKLEGQILIITTSTEIYHLELIHWDATSMQFKWKNIIDVQL